MSDRDKLIDRLQKLFALSTSSNQHEAELALSKANELMEEHQIALDEVELREEGIITEGQEVVECSRLDNYVLCSLSGIAASLYSAEVVMEKSSRDDGFRATFIGAKLDIAAAKMTFLYLYRSWRSIVGADLRAEVRAWLPPRAGRTFRRSHAEGFAGAVARRVAKLVAERNRSVRATTGRDLVVLKGAATKEYVRERFGKLRMFRARASGDSGIGSWEGLVAGERSGNAIPLHGGIEEREEALMIAAAGST